MFRRIVNENKDIYHKCEKKSHRFFLAVSIIAAVERKGGRFLKKHDEKGEGNWIKISRKDAIAKTNQALREQDIKQRKSSPQAIERQVEKKALQQQRKLQEKRHLQKQVMETIPLTAVAASTTTPLLSPSITRKRMMTSSSSSTKEEQTLTPRTPQEVHCGLEYDASTACGAAVTPKKRRKVAPRRSTSTVPGQWVSEDNPLLNVILKADVGIPLDSVTSNNDLGGVSTHSTNSNKFASLEDIMLEEDLSLADDSSTGYSSENDDNNNDNVNYYNGISTSFFHHHPAADDFPSSQYYYYGGGGSGFNNNGGWMNGDQYQHQQRMAYNYPSSHEQQLQHNHRFNDGGFVVDQTDVLEGLAFLSS